VAKKFALLLQLKKLPNANNLPRGENSPNPVIVVLIFYWPLVAFDLEAKAQFCPFTFWQQYPRQNFRINIYPYLAGEVIEVEFN
jgi:hypothetical protein